MAVRMVAVALALCIARPVAAETVAVAAAGAAGIPSGCITVAGATVAGRPRWVAAFYPDAPPVTPAGPCPEERAHIETPITCIAATTDPDGRTELLLSGRDGNRTYGFRFVDGGPAGPDEAGSGYVTTSDPSDCGASGLETSVVTSGGIHIAAA